MPDWRPWLPGGVLALGCLVTLGIDRQRETPLAASLDSIPLTMAGTAFTPLTIAADEQRAAGMSAYIFRSALVDSTPLSLYVGYYDQQTQGKTIHSPKNCLPGAGWDALQQTLETVATPQGPATVNRYLLQNKTSRALVLYWYQGRGRVAADEYRVKWELLRDAALRGRTEEALVRIVVMLDGGMEEAAAARLASRLAGELIPAVSRVLPEW